MDTPPTPPTPPATVSEPRSPKPPLAATATVPPPLLNRVIGWFIALLFSPGIIFLMFFLALNFFLTYYLNPTVKAQLESFVESTTDSLYVLDLGDLRINTEDISVEARHISLRPTLSPEAHFKRTGKNALRVSVSASRLRVLRVGVRDALQRDGVKIGFIAIDSLRVEILKDSLPASATMQSGGAAKDSVTLPMRLSAIVPQIALDSVRLRDFDFRYTTRGDTSQTIEVSLKQFLTTRPSWSFESGQIRGGFFSVKSPDVLLSTQIAAPPPPPGGKKNRRAGFKAASPNRIPRNATATKRAAPNPPAAPADSLTFFERLTKRLPRVLFDSLRVSDARVRLVTSEGEKRSETVLPEFSIQMRGIEIDSLKKPAERLPFFSKDFRLSLTGFIYRLPDSIYTLRLGPISLSTADSTLTIDSVRFSPEMTHQEFIRRQRYQGDRFKVNAKRLSIAALDFRRLVYDEAIMARTVRLDGLLLDIYSDKHPPLSPVPAVFVMPNDLIKSMQTAFRIDTIDINDGFVRYSERPPAAAAPSPLTFERVNATITNVTNDKLLMTDRTPAVLDATALLMGAGRMKTVIELPLLSRGFDVRYSGRVGEMKAAALNAFLKGIARVEFFKGDVERITFDVSVKNGFASGRVGAIYRNLQVTVLPPHRKMQSGLREGLMSFLANQFKIKPHNAPELDNPVRTGRVRMKKTKRHAFFQFLWLSLRGGLSPIVGI
ncbi:MAG: hypothetical protein IAF08_13575 [Rhizobacter sp.]|nr:hypothetical protein [Chlorobiales bacterium]